MTDFGGDCPRDLPRTSPNDGSNNKIWILRRDTLDVVGSFASYGRQGGQVLSAHSMAVDQQGNIYVGETRGRRIQKFRLLSGC